LRALSFEAGRKHDAVLCFDAGRFGCEHIADHVRLRASAALDRTRGALEIIVDDFSNDRRSSQLGSLGPRLTFLELSLNSIAFYHGTKLSVPAGLEK
jgi:hypothetical protein